jgi:hypothetical protein
MRYLLSLMLAAIATLSLAGCAGPYYRGYTVVQPSPGPNCRRVAYPGDTKIKIYCKRASPAKAQTGGDITCRRLTRGVDDTIETFCGNAADWQEYDTWAVNAGVTCSWDARAGKDTPHETCLTVTQWVAQWRVQAAKLRRGLANSDGFSVPAGVQSGSSPAYATSYGGFSPDGTVGQTW